MSCLSVFWNYYEFNKIIRLPCRGCTVVQLILKILVYVIFIGVVTGVYKGHQKSYELSSSVVIKLNGVGMTNNDQRIIWDSVDSVVPPQEENGLFITTNFITTYNQTQGVCPENPSVKNSTCLTDADCQKDGILYLGNGVMTGKCVQARPNIQTCEIKSWCPIEKYTTGDMPYNLIKEITNYTILIKNTIVFNNVNVQRSNIAQDTVDKIPEDCIYNGSDKLLKYCPIFKVSSLIEAFNEKNITKLLIYGGIGRITINWNCDLDYSYNSCKPEYSFSELFSIIDNFNNGMNFRYANYYEKDMKEYRTLFKVYGIRILVEVRGEGGKFHFITFSKLMGSTLSYLFIVELIIGLIITRKFSIHIYEDVPKEVKTLTVSIKTVKIPENGANEQIPLKNNKYQHNGL